MAEEGPVFSNGTQGDIWYSARCNRCVHRDREDGLDGPCDDFFFVAMTGSWPEFIRVDVTAPEDRECDRFEVDPLAD